LSAVFLSFVLSLQGAKRSEYSPKGVYVQVLVDGRTEVHWYSSGDDATKWSPAQALKRRGCRIDLVRDLPERLPVRRVRLGGVCTVMALGGNWWSQRRANRRLLHELQLWKDATPSDPLPPPLLERVEGDWYSRRSILWAGLKRALGVMLVMMGASSVAPTGAMFAPLVVLAWRGPLLWSRKPDLAGQLGRLAESIGASVAPASLASAPDAPVHLGPTPAMVERTLRSS
jgi:hypothetical protein